MIRDWFETRGAHLVDRETTLAACATHPVTRALLITGPSRDGPPTCARCLRCWVRWQRLLASEVTRG